MQLTINVDGGSRGNPGPAGAGVVIRCRQSGRVVYQAGVFLGKVTNNVAEYRGLLAGLEKAVELGADDVLILSDSELLVRQMTGVYKVKNAGLMPLVESAKELQTKFQHCKYRHIPREQNSAADAMANKAMDAKKTVIASDSGDDAPAAARPTKSTKPAKPAAAPIAGSPTTPMTSPDGPEVIGLQYNIAWEHKPTNFAKVTKMLAGANIGENSLVVLPEMFATGFSLNVGVTAQGPEQEEENFLAQAASQQKSTFVAGLVNPAGRGKGLNQAVAFDPAGRVIARYTKMHPYRYGREHEHFDRGRDVVLFDWAGFTVAPMICYDLRFPEIFRTAVRRGANLLMVLANWPAARETHWLTLLRARAIENLSYVVGVNRVGNSPDTAYAGHSIIIDPRGQTIAEAGGSECVLRARLDLPALQEYRRQFPALEDMLGDYVHE